jgi:TonB-dependent Receptor Plug Domain
MGLVAALSVLAAGVADMPPVVSSGPQPSSSVQAVQAQPASQAGVARYGADFFAPMRPATAWDMIQRLPGFAFDPGLQVRGFAGAAGNVLIDGDRPTTKQDDLQSILQRIPAARVDHIDVIRGGAQASTCTARPCSRTWCASRAQA